jgi:glycosyltransferase involved in cell wall biosynthesis
VPEPVVSVVVPVWDAYVGPRLLAALESLQTQDCQCRVVVVDNASQIEVPSAPGVEVVRSPRRLTVGTARNLGLTRVDTPFVVAWDADDVMLPGTLEFLERGIGSEPTLAAFATAIIEQPSGVRHRWPRRWIARLVLAPRLFALLDSIWSLYPTTGATIMRTELVRAAGGYGDADSGEDWCLGVSLAFRGGIGWSERPGRLYRLHERSMWASHMTPRDLLRHARAVRERIRTDEGIPRWVLLLLPLIQLGQYVGVAAHVVVAAARR